MTLTTQAKSIAQVWSQKQADFERIVGEIGQKLREAPSMDYLVKIVAEELSQALGATHSVVKVGIPPQQLFQTSGPQSTKNGRSATPEEVE